MWIEVADFFVTKQKMTSKQCPRVVSTAGSIVMVTDGLAKAGWRICDLLRSFMRPYYTKSHLHFSEFQLRSGKTEQILESYAAFHIQYLLYQIHFRCVLILQYNNYT